jgi:hypothetical protein
MDQKKEYKVVVGSDAEREEILFTEVNGETTFVYPAIMRSGLVEKFLCKEVGQPLKMVVYLDRTQICSDGLSARQGMAHELRTLKKVTCIE